MGPMQNMLPYIWTGCCASWAIIGTVTQGERELMLLSLPPSEPDHAFSLHTIHVWETHDTDLANWWQNCKTTPVTFIISSLFSWAYMGKGFCLEVVGKQAICVVLQNEKLPNTQLLFPLVCPCFAKGDHSNKLETEKHEIIQERNRQTHSRL